MCTETVEEIVADFFGIPVSDVDNETSPKTLASWNSMKHIELVMTFEVKFGKQFAPVDIPLLTSVGKIKEVLNVVR
jgi:acyl carrier protein